MGIYSLVTEYENEEKIGIFSTKWLGLLHPDA